MQKNLLKEAILKKIKGYSSNPLEDQKAFIREAFGMTSPFALQADNVISEKQIEVLEDAIKRYQRLEDIRKFTNLVLTDIDTVTEEDIKRAVELEEMVSIDDEKAVLSLIQNEGFLKDLNEADFSEILALNPFNNKDYEQNSAEFDLWHEEENFDDFDF